MMLCWQLRLIVSSRLQTQATLPSETNCSRAETNATEAKNKDDGRRFEGGDNGQVAIVAVSSSIIVMSMKNNVDACSCSATALLEQANALAETKSHGKQRGWMEGCGDDAAYKMKKKMAWTKGFKRGAPECMGETCNKSDAK